MDGRRFDEVTKTLGNAANRRGVIKGLAGSAVASVLALRAAAPADAAPGRKCNNDNQCQNFCDNERASCCNGQCVGKCGPKRFLNGKCRCCRRRRGKTTCERVNGCGA